MSLFQGFQAGTNKTRYGDVMDLAERYERVFDNFKFLLCMVFQIPMSSAFFESGKHPFLAMYFIRPKRAGVVCMLVELSVRTGRYIIGSPWRLSRSEVLLASQNMDRLLSKAQELWWEQTVQALDTGVF
jgi:hypothetical protein